MDYSRAGLDRFLETIARQGLVNANTAQGWRAAVTKILADLSPAEDADVRRVDVDLAIKRCHNKNPGALAPSSLGEYRRRIDRVIKEFVAYTEDPAGFKPKGRGAPTTSENVGAKKEGRANKRTPQGHDGGVEERAPDPLTATATRSGLTLSFPIRPDFLAQIVVPRDITLEEARRLSAFVQTLAVDFRPAT